MSIGHQRVLEQNRGEENETNAYLYIGSFASKLIPNFIHRFPLRRRQQLDIHAVQPTNGTACSNVESCLAVHTCIPIICW